MKRVWIGLVVLMVGVAPHAAAQQEALGGRYTISIIGARTYFDDSSALKDTWTGGLEVGYNLRNWVALGGYFTLSRPRSDETFFPLVRLEFQDTVLLQLVSQQVTHFNYGAMVSVRGSLQRFFARGIAGVGAYVFNLDDERINTPAVPGTLEDSFSNLAWNIGGVVGYQFGQTGSVELRVRDFVYTDYDRERFNASEPLLGAPDLPHPRENIPPPKSTIHNINLELGFSFTLGGS